MELEPQMAALPDGGAAIWAHERKAFSAVGVWTERRSGHGEDAEPTLMFNSALGRGLLGVYDGLGGAGGRPVGTTPDGRLVSNAFVASRLAHLIVRDWFTDRAHEVRGEDLEARLKLGFDAARPRARSRVAGNLTRDLPTTLALIEFDCYRTGPLAAVTAWWAGDSRCYLLTPDSGLQQISRDDSEIDDALETLIADQPMTNLVSAAGDFRVHRYGPNRVDRPFVLLCATDGFFNYVGTPALFECGLLSELHGATDVRDWGRRLARWVRERAADDASLALVAVGFADFEAMRAAFDPRGRYLYEKHWYPMDAYLQTASNLSKEEQREALIAVRNDSWQSYRETYNLLLPPPEPAEPVVPVSATDGGER